MARTSQPAARVQVYLADPRVATALSRQARVHRIPVSQAAGQAIARGLQRTSGDDPEERLLKLERALRDHMRSTVRDMQIVQELLIELARLVFLRFPESSTDTDPTVQARVDQRVERLLDATAARIAAHRAPPRSATANDDGRDPAR